MNLVKYFVGGLTKEIQENDLYGLFKSYGKIVDFSIMYNKNKKRNRGFGFIVFDDNSNLSRLEAKRYHTLLNATVECRIAVTEDDLKGSRFLAKLLKQDCFGESQETDVNTPETVAKDAKEDNFSYL